MSFASVGAMGVVVPVPTTADRMTKAVCEIRRRRGCIYYDELAVQFTRAEIAEHLREALFRAQLRMRAPWPGFPSQIAVDERLVAMLAAGPRRPGARAH